MNAKTPTSIARQLIARYDVEAGEAVTHLQLQKLLYYAQGWSLALCGEPLFQGDIQAWDHGPVQKEVYREYNTYGWQSIVLPEHERRPVANKLLDAIKLFYGAFHGKQLEEQTHQENPWKDTYKPDQFDLVIPVETIRTFFTEGFAHFPIHRQFIDFWYRFSKDITPLGDLPPLGEEEYRQELEDLGLA
nr:hypothetical protein 15 [bacterium]